MAKTKKTTGKKASSKKTFTKTEVPVNEATYTKAEIKAFQDECGKKPMFTISEFNSTLKKDVTELTYKDIRILVSKVGWLSDDERANYKDVLVRENLTASEEERYLRIYPNPEKFKKYFPVKEIKE
jgi:hypothetical protein